MQLTPEQVRANEIFFPYSFGKQLHVEKSQSRFVQYTTAEAAVSILRSKEVWMRKSSIMNDFMETEYGFNCLVGAYNGESGARFKAILDREFPGLSADLENRFNSWVPHFRSDTYLTSISEHLENEDQIGRLSMWRAYGGVTGVAIVLRSTPFVSASNALKIYSSPVAYFSFEQFNREFSRIADNVDANAEFVRQLGRDAMIGYIFNMFRFSMWCTKHPGFHEEREWRIVYTPEFDKSERVLQELKVIRGIPQPVFKIPLRNVPEEGLVGIELPEFIERIIIGPTQYPNVMHQAFVTMLADAGVDDAAQKVWISDIPLRQGQ
jgi:hypothetical protein